MKALIIIVVITTALVIANKSRNRMPVSQTSVVPVAKPVVGVKYTVTIDPKFN